METKILNFLVAMKTIMETNNYGENGCNSMELLQVLQMDDSPQQQKSKFLNGAQFREVLNVRALQPVLDESFAFLYDYIAHNLEDNNTNAESGGALLPGIVLRLQECISVYKKMPGINLRLIQDATGAFVSRLLHLIIGIDVETFRTQCKKMQVASIMARMLKSEDCVRQTVINESVNYFKRICGQSPNGLRPNELESSMLLVQCLRDVLQEIVADNRLCYDLPGLDAELKKLSRCIPEFIVFKVNECKNFIQRANITMC